MEQNERQEVLIVMLNSFIAAQFMLQCNDYLKGTDKYRHRLKTHLNGIEKELIHLIEHDYKVLWNKDDKAIMLLHQGFEQFVKNLSIEKFIKLSPEQVVDFGTLLVEFHNAPELMLHRLGITTKT